MAENELANIGTLSSYITKKLDACVDSIVSDLRDVKQLISFPREDGLVSEEEVKELDTLDEKVQEHCEHYKEMSGKWSNHFGRSKGLAVFTAILIVPWLICYASGLRYETMPVAMQILFSAPVCLSAFLIARQVFKTTHPIESTNEKATDPQEDQSEWLDTITTSDVARRHKEIYDTIHDKLKPLKNEGSFFVTCCVLNYFSYVFLFFFFRVRFDISAEVFHKNIFVNLWEGWNAGSFLVFQYSSLIMIVVTAVSFVLYSPRAPISSKKDN